MKNKIEVEKIIIVNKDNFQESLKEFRDILNSKLFDFIIINNDISTSNPKIKEKEGEIVFSEFTLCKDVNYQGKDIKYTFNTFIVPSLKFHRYSVDEIASFNSIFLKYLTNEKSIYDFNLINSSNSLSYDNIHKRDQFEKSLNLIIKDGKPFKKENKTSYYYYPKAFELPSKKYQTKFEHLLKYFVEQYYDVIKPKLEKENNNPENDKKENNDDNTSVFISDKYISDFKFLNNFLDFRWGILFEKGFENYKIFVNGFKINFQNAEIKLHPKFLEFVETLKKALESQNEIENFELNIIPEDKNEISYGLLNNWKQYILAEDSVVEFSYDFNENKIKFALKANKTIEKKKKLENIIKFLSFILSVPNEIKNKTEFEIKDIFFRRINMKNLFPLNIRNNIEFTYHLITKVDNKFKLEKNKDYYLSKISYKEIFVNNKNEEEILFGYKLEPQLKSLLEVREPKRAELDLNKEKTKTISLEFGKDLDIIIKDEKFKKILNGYFSKFTLIPSNKESETNAKFRSIKYTMIKVPNFGEKEFKNDFYSLMKRAKEIKRNLLLDEEIGMSYFYDAIFKKENINIYGTNLKNKIYFPIKQLLLEENKNNDEEIQKILEKVNIYDISYICLKKGINFFNKYLKLKKEELTKERTMTQRLGYVIEETDALKERENLGEFRNKFYLDEKDKITEKHYLCVDKNTLNEKAEEIIKIFRDKTDFAINKDASDNKVLELNIIDPGKYDQIENIDKEIKAL
jgi:hypothetical protein